MAEIENLDEVYSDFSNVQKVALLLIALGQKWATEVMRRMKHSNVKQVAYWVSQLRYVPQELTEKVIREFHEKVIQKTSLASAGGSDYIFEVLSGIMGDVKAKELVEQLCVVEENEVFQILTKVDPKQLAHYFKDETPQTIALMLAHLEADRAGAILGALPKEKATDVLIAIAVMSEADPDVVNTMEKALVENLGQIASGRQMRKIGGTKPVAAILNAVSDQVGKDILDAIVEKDFDLATAIKDLMFVFDDLVLLDDKSMQAVIKDIEQTDLIMALKGANEDVKEKLFKNISQRQVEAINDELAFMGPVKASVVMQAQQRIVQVIRKLDEEGKILIAGRGSGDDAIVE